MRDHTYLNVKQLCVRRMPGWSIPCNAPKATVRSDVGTKGGRMPVELARKSIPEEKGRRTDVSFSEVEDV